LIHRYPADQGIVYHRHRKTTNNRCLAIVEATMRNLANMIANNPWLDTPEKVEAYCKQVANDLANYALEMRKEALNPQLKAATTLRRRPFRHGQLSLGRAHHQPSYSGAARQIECRFGHRSCAGTQTCWAGNGGWLLSNDMSRRRALLLSLGGALGLSLPTAPPRLLCR
jgi:hypothetical protein